HGRTGAVLYLHRLRFLLRHRHAAGLARLPAYRGAGGVGLVLLLDPVLRPSVRPHRTKEHVHDRRGRDRRVRFCLLRHAEHRPRDGHLPRDHLVAHPARYDVRSAGRSRKALPAGCATAALRWAISLRRSSPAARRRSSPLGCSAPFTPRMRSPSISRLARCWACSQPPLSPITPATPSPANTPPYLPPHSL